LSNSASTASCSIRFSLLTMISGAPRSISLLRRLLRLMTRRDHRHAVEHHAHRRVAGGLERRDDLEPLERAELLLTLAAADGLAQVLGLGLDVEVLQQRLDRLGTHGTGEVVAVAVVQLAVDALVRDELLHVQLDERRPDLLEPVQLALGPVAELAHLALATLLDLAADVALGAVALQLGQVGLELLGPGLHVRVAALLDPLALDGHLVLERRQVRVPLLRVHRGDHVRREVNDLLEVLGSQVEQVAQPARDALEVPDVGDGSGQLDVAHPLTTHLGAGDLHAAALADDALEADALVLTAVALPVAGRAEDLLAEEPVLLRLEGAVVDCLRLLDLAVRPLADVLRRGQADAQFVEEVDVEHYVSPLFPQEGICAACSAVVS
jgi:hypothetical protein